MTKAHFEVCAICQKHGRFVFSDGFLGLEYGSKRHAMFVLHSGASFSRFSGDEDKEVSEQIHSSSLPAEVADADKLFLLRIELYNQFYCSEVNGLEVEEILRLRLPSLHEWIEEHTKHLSETDVPDNFISDFTAFLRSQEN